MKFTEFFISMLSDHTGGISTLRVLFSAWVFAVIVWWSYACFSTKTLHDIPGGVLGMTGALAGAKVLQRYGEKNDPTV